MAPRAWHGQFAINLPISLIGPETSVRNTGLRPPRSRSSVLFAPISPHLDLQPQARLQAQAAINPLFRTKPNVILLPQVSDSVTWCAVRTALSSFRRLLGHDVIESTNPSTIRCPNVQKTAPTLYPARICFTALSTPSSSLRIRHKHPSSSCSGFSRNLNAARPCPSPPPRIKIFSSPVVRVAIRPTPSQDYMQTQV